MAELWMNLSPGSAAPAQFQRGGWLLPRHLLQCWVVFAWS